MHQCSWPNCAQEGSFPAPKNPRNLSERQYFCAEHIKQFNKQWDGLKGFSENEIYGFQDGTATWQRPTWAMGATPDSVRKAPPTGARVDEEPFAKVEDLYGFFKSRVAREMSGESLPSRRLPADVRAACTIFSIENPLEAGQLKQRYRTLVKQHHPDVNKDADAPEHIKRINVAYRILADFAERRGLQ